MLSILERGLPAYEFPSFKEDERSSAAWTALANAASTHKAVSETKRHNFFVEVI
jgi:hypothetical protein